MARLPSWESLSIRLTAPISVMSGPRCEVKKLRRDLRLLGRLAETLRSWASAWSVTSLPQNSVVLPSEAAGFGLGEALVFWEAAGRRTAGAINSANSL